MMTAIDWYQMMLRDTECDAGEILEAIVPFMDDDIREEVHADLAPCGSEKFLIEYCVRHEAKYGEEFVML